MPKVGSWTFPPTGDIVKSISVTRVVQPQNVGRRFCVSHQTLEPATDKAVHRKKAPNRNVSI